MIEDVEGLEKYLRRHKYDWFSDGLTKNGEIRFKKDDVMTLNGNPGTWSVKSKNEI